MRVLVTGATGFVGRWLMRELAGAGHDPVAAPSRAELDLSQPQPLAELIDAVRPDAVAHLAAVSFGPDARRDPAHAMAVNAGGTEQLFRGLEEARSDALVLVTSSSEVYGAPDPGDLPLGEDAPLRGSSPYARSKLAQEAVARHAYETGRRPVVVTRAFNHTGPGQRSDFVAPALVGRVLDVRDGRASVVRVGNLDVKRDIGDVRDVVRAYRLLLEAAVDGRIPDGWGIYNVATGTSVSIRRILDTIAYLARVEVAIEVDETLVRLDDPPEIRGDATALGELTGWAPVIDLETTLADVIEAMQAAG